METGERYILVCNGKELITRVCQPATTVNDAHNPHTKPNPSPYITSTMRSTPADIALHDPQGRRLYLNREERQSFLSAANKEPREIRMYAHVLHYTGARPIEICNITYNHINLSDSTITIRSIKKRLHDSQGNPNRPVFRIIPVPHALTNSLDLVFNIRELQTQPDKANRPLFPSSRSTYWRHIKCIMQEANITGPQASPKGLRHGFAIAMLSGSKPIHITLLRDLLGHSDTRTTECYLKIQDKEKQQAVINAWS